MGVLTYTKVCMCKIPAHTQSHSNYMKYIPRARKKKIFLQESDHFDKNENII